MEAKDTVMSNEQLNKPIYFGSDLTAISRKALEAQAKVSFRAGMEEVVEVIREGGYLMGDKWQAQLLEWGVK